MARDVQRGAHLDVSSAGFGGRLEVLVGPSGRVQRSDELKGRIVAESLEFGATVVDVARRHGATRWQIYNWRQKAKRGELALPPIAAGSAFAALVVEEAPPPTELARSALVVEVLVGDVVIRAPESAEAEHLARVIRAVRLAAT